MFAITQPDELVDFALAYFTRQKAKRNAIAAENNNLSDESMLSEDEEFGEWDTQFSIWWWWLYGGKAHTRRTYFKSDSRKVIFVALKRNSLSLFHKPLQVWNNLNQSDCFFWSAFEIVPIRLFVLIRFGTFWVTQASFISKLYGWVCGAKVHHSYAQQPCMCQNVPLKLAWKSVDHFLFIHQAKRKQTITAVSTWPICTFSGRFGWNILAVGLSAVHACMGDIKGIWQNMESW